MIIKEYCLRCIRRRVVCLWLHSCTRGLTLTLRHLRYSARLLTLGNANEMNVNSTAVAAAFAPFLIYDLLIARRSTNPQTCIDGWIAMSLVNVTLCFAKLCLALIDTLPMAQMHHQPWQMFVNCLTAPTQKSISSSSRIANIFLTLFLIEEGGKIGWNFRVKLASEKKIKDENGDDVTPPRRRSRSPFVSALSFFMMMLNSSLTLWNLPYHDGKRRMFFIYCLVAKKMLDNFLHSTIIGREIKVQRSKAGNRFRE